MADYETMVKRVMVADMTGKPFDVKTCCARCNLPLGKKPTQQIGEYHYGGECIHVALDTQKQENDAERTRVIVCFNKIRYSACTTIIGQYGLRDQVTGERTPFCDIGSVEKVFAKWEFFRHDMESYCCKRWSNPWEVAHRDMMIEHLSELFD